MKSIVFFIVLFSLFSLKMMSQINKNINPKNNWFYGIELGLNTITSIHPNHVNSIQGGLLVEYYFSKHFSIYGRVKYFKTGVSNKYDSAKGIFNGAVVSVPLNTKWEYDLANRFSINIKLGIAFNQEIISKYNYPKNENTSFSAFYQTFNPGLGFNYFISKNTAIYLNYEVYILGNDRDNTDFIEIIPNSPNNNLFNIGIKHSFKKGN